MRGARRQLMPCLMAAGAVLAVAILAPVLTPHDPYAQDLAAASAKGRPIACASTPTRGKPS